jgi:hypothetical protein
MYPKKDAAAYPVRAHLYITVNRNGALCRGRPADSRQNKNAKRAFIVLPPPIQIAQHAFVSPANDTLHFAHSKPQNIV